MAPELDHARALFFCVSSEEEVDRYGTTLFSFLYEITGSKKNNDNVHIGSSLSTLNKNLTEIEASILKPQYGYFDVEGYAGKLAHIRVAPELVPKSRKAQETYDAKLKEIIDALNEEKIIEFQENFPDFVKGDAVVSRYAALQAKKEEAHLHPRVLYKKLANILGFMPGISESEYVTDENDIKQINSFMDRLFLDLAIRISTAEEFKNIQFSLTDEEDSYVESCDLADHVSQNMQEGKNHEGLSSKNLGDIDLNLS